LLRRIERAEAEARESGDEPVGDVGDQSDSDEQKDEQFKEAETDWMILKQVRDALKRIEDGTFGYCVVDGEPIEEKRLEAVPWTPYCLKHAQLLERSESTRTPTL
jgi:DnaK suppressor protein